MKPPILCCLDSRATNNGSLYGRFLLGPFPIDLSLTVATTLRRGLLHSQPSFGIISAEIEGAVHEYASLPGMQESVLELLLNLGEVVLTTNHRNLLERGFRNRNLMLNSNNGVHLASIRISGPGIITAKDIHWPNGIYCVNPDTHIATLSSNETLAMRIKIMAASKEQITALSQNNTLQVKANVESQDKELPNHLDNYESSDLSTKNNPIKQESQVNTQSSSRRKTIRTALSNSILTSHSLELLKKDPEEESDFEAKGDIDLISKAPISSQKRKDQRALYKELSNVDHFVKTGVSSQKQERGCEFPVSPCSYPVQKVNFVIERDDQWEGYRHRIILEVWTNGSISPRQAIFDTVAWTIKLIYSFREPTGLNASVSNTMLR